MEGEVFLYFAFDAPRQSRSQFGQCSASAGFCLRIVTFSVRSPKTCRMLLQGPAIVDD